MVCTPVPMGDGTVAIVCSRNTRTPKCSICRERDGTRQCDFPKGKGTCDKYLCETCAVRIEPEVDFCPSHGRDTKPPEQLGLF